MTDRIDRFLTLVKWPVAVVCVILLPGSVWAFVELIRRIAADFGPIMPFFIGFLVYFGLWLVFLRRRFFGSLFSTFEHELTHAVFAWLTLHKVVGLRATWHDGGEIRYRGRGNWLIIMGPYFFPTFSVVALLALLLVPEAYRDEASGILGVTISYHVTSTWLETHRDQPDLKRVGYVFSVAFIPTANLIAYGLLIAFAYSGVSEVGTFFSDVGSTTSGWLGSLFGLIV